MMIALMMTLTQIMKNNKKNDDIRWHSRPGAKQTKTFKGSPSEDGTLIKVGLNKWSRDEDEETSRAPTNEKAWTNSKKSKSYQSVTVWLQGGSGQKWNLLRYLVHWQDPGESYFSSYFTFTFSFPHSPLFFHFHFFFSSCTDKTLASPSVGL